MCKGLMARESMTYRRKCEKADFLESRKEKGDSERLGRQECPCVMHCLVSILREFEKKKKSLKVSPYAKFAY